VKGGFFLKKPLERLLQNCFQSGDLCQGTTLVVPQMDHRSNSGFSRCEIASN
jgi:hypothetical protein